MKISLKYQLNWSIDKKMLGKSLDYYWRDFLGFSAPALRSTVFLRILGIRKTRIVDSVASGIKGIYGKLLVDDVDDERSTIDSTSIKAHRQTARAVKGNQSEPSRGDLSSKRPLAVNTRRPIRIPRRIADAPPSWKA